MNMKTCCFGLAAIVGVAVGPSPAAYAQPTGAHRRHGPPPTCVPIQFRSELPTYDKNNNGRLDRDEHRAMRRAHRDRDRKKYDQDRNGRLSKTERKKLHYDRRVHLFESIDRNRDAELSKAEATGSCTPVEWHFSHIDRDKNGSISWAEFEKAGRRMRPPGPPPHRRP